MRPGHGHWRRGQRHCGYVYDQLGGPRLAARRAAWLALDCPHGVAHGHRLVARDGGVACQMSGRPRLVQRLTRPFPYSWTRRGLSHRWPQEDQEAARAPTQDPRSSLPTKGLPRTSPRRERRCVRTRRRRGTFQCCGGVPGGTLAAEARSGVAPGEETQRAATALSRHGGCELGGHHDARRWRRRRARCRWPRNAVAGRAAAACRWRQPMGLMRARAPEWCRVSARQRWWSA